MKLTKSFSAAPIVVSFANHILVAENVENSYDRFFKGGREVARQSGALGASQLIGWIQAHR